MISKELAAPFGLFFKYLKNFFSTIVLSLLINIILQMLKQIKPLGRKIKTPAHLSRGSRDGGVKDKADHPGFFIDFIF